jgi:CBS-domain-containing membrane protein
MIQINELPREGHILSPVRFVVVDKKQVAMQAKDVMTTKVISVSPGSPVHKVVDLLLKYRISAVPVVDSAQKLVGIVSEGDLLRPESVSSAGTRRLSWMGEMVSGGGSYEKSSGRTANTVMTRSVVTVNEDTPLNEIAGLLERHHIKRVPVLSNGRLVGVVSRANLLHGLANIIVEHHGPGAAKDRQLRAELVKLLLDEHKPDTILVNVTVNDGNVRLWGIADSADTAATAEAVAKSFPGVKSVENNLVDKT